MHSPYVSMPLAALRPMRLAVVALSVALAATACVPARSLEDEKTKSARATAEAERMKAELNSLTARIAVTNEELENANRRLGLLTSDSTSRGQQLREYLRLNRELGDKQDQLTRVNDKMSQNNLDENRNLRTNLTSTQAQLEAREKKLNELEEKLKAREEANTRLKSDLESREGRVKELTRILNQKDSVVNALQAKVSNALNSFKNSGLTVETRNGKVYVSLSEKLLFATGSTAVDARGRDAILQLARLLQDNRDITVMVEGHTDDVPYKGGNGPIKDNWDLSVLRATTIVRLITIEGGLSTTRVSAAGQGQYMPRVQGTTAEARAANRRTEIILTPKLDDLFEIIGNK